MDQDFRAETLGGFARHGWSAVDPGAVEDADFYRLVWGLAHFLAMCGLELDDAIQPPMRLGDKVRVSEQICQRLHQLDPSFTLHPHQITLLDWPSLKPIAKAVCVMGEEAKFAGELLREEEGEVEEEEPVEVDHDQLQALERLVLDQQRELGVKSRQLVELDLEITEQSKSGGVEELFNLLREVDQLKAEEKEFKLACRSERDRLLQPCVDLSPAVPLEQVELEHRKLDTMLKRHRVKLAGVSRLEANSRRKQDEGVTVSERKQYEQRLVELYEEIALRSDAHRKQVAVFNACSSKLRMVHGQIALLRSIRDGFLKSKGNAVAEHTFALQFPSVLAAYDASLAKAQDRMAELDRDRVEVDDKLAKVYAQKRHYYQQQLTAVD